MSRHEHRPNDGIVGHAQGYLYGGREKKETLEEWLRRCCEEFNVLHGRYPISIVLDVDVPEWKGAGKIVKGAALQVGRLAILQ
jgi:hypothetical protein